MKPWMIALIIAGDTAGLVLVSRLLAAAGLACRCG